MRDVVQFQMYHNIMHKWRVPPKNITIIHLLIQSFPNTTCGYRRLLLVALACLTQFPNTHSFISVQFPSRWSCASTYICKVETLAFTDCDMPTQEFSLCERVYIHNTYICNFSNFVALFTDNTDAPVSCDKCFRDFWGVCSNLSPISSNVSSL